VSTPKNSFRREIELDFVRGIAILMVLDFHAKPFGILSYPFRLLGIPSFGWAGVDVFFVLSGFLVGGLLTKEWKVRGRINSKQFLIRRGFKIWPQYYLFLFLMIASGHRTVHMLWANLLNVQNYYYANSVAHTWSLAVEEHAYLLIVFLFYLAYRWEVRTRYVFLLFATLAASVVLLRLLLSREGFDTFPYTHTRIDGIFYGVLLSILYHYKPETFRRVQGLNWLWFTVLAAALVFFRIGFHTWWAGSVEVDVANLFGIALLMLLYRNPGGRKHGALYRFVAWIGLYSYGIYLWHISFTAPLSGIGNRLPNWLASLWIAMAPGAAGVIAGIFTTKFVELPMLKLRDRWFPRPVDSAVGTPAELEAPESS
jgi:peptidoglycan/LPS O-acetylase OafA/YrhL